MGKNRKDSKDDARNPNSIPNRDIIQRLNFLYQAGVYLNGITDGHLGPSVPSVTSQDTSTQADLAQAKDEVPQTNDRRPRQQRRVTVYDISRSYVKTMKIIGQKTNVRMDPSVKRSLCKTCNAVLIPGSTATVRIKNLPSHGHAVTYTCWHCSTSRRIPASSTSTPDYYPPAVHKLSTGPSSSNVPEGKSEMDVEVKAPADDIGKKSQEKKPRNRKKPVHARPLPFFAREDHVVYVGSELLEGEKEGI